MRCSILLFAVLMPGVLTAADSECDAARKVFAASIAKIYNIPVQKITVQPVYPGLPDNPYDSLKTGELFALRANWPGNDLGPTGFAAADGRVAFARHPDGVRALLDACRISDPQKSLPLADIIKRLAWIYRHAGEPVEMVFHEAEIQRSPGGINIIYQTRTSGGTGSILYSQVEIGLPPSGPTTIQINKIPGPLQ